MGSGAAFNWEGFLVYAQANAQSPSETIQRTAASRAYYAVYNICREWLRAQGHTFDASQPSHKQVWDAFKNATAADPASAPDWRLLAQHGTSLRKLRNNADYDDRVHDLPKRLQGALLKAKLALDLLSTLKTR